MTWAGPPTAPVMTAMTAVRSIPPDIGHDGHHLRAAIMTDDCVNSSHWRARLVVSAWMRCRTIRSPVMAGVTEPSCAAAAVRSSWARA